jgi:hypothetical protein
LKKEDDKEIELKIQFEAINKFEKILD